MLQRNPPQKGTSGSRTEDKDQRENLQGTEKDCGKQEEIISNKVTEFDLYVLKTGNRDSSNSEESRLV